MNRDVVKGMMVGVGVGLVVPVLFPALARVAKPSMDAAIRAGVMAWERGRESLAEFGEYAEDMAAEARARHGVSGAAAPLHPGGNGEAHRG